MFEVTITDKEQSVLNIILSIVFIIMGIAFFVEGIPTKTITIVPTETQVNAYLHRRSTWPPFKSIDEFVSNVKQAILETKINYKKDRKYEDYLVALETYSGKKFYVTDVSMFLVSEQKLQNQINEAIQNKTHFTKTFREDFLLFFGLTLIIVGIILQLYESGKRKKNKEIKVDEEKNSF
jgi:hypothetical protein